MHFFFNLQHHRTVPSTRKDKQKRAQHKLAEFILKAEIRARTEEEAAGEVCKPDHRLQAARAHGKVKIGPGRCRRVGSSHSDSMHKPKASLKSSEDVFKRLSQDPNWAPLADRVRIGYMDRVVGGFLEMPLRSFVPIAKGGEMPFHRLWWFRLVPAYPVPQADLHCGAAAAEHERDGSSATSSTDSAPHLGATAETGEDVKVQEDVAPCAISQEELRLTADLLWDREARLDLIFRSGDTSQILAAERKSLSRPDHLRGSRAPSSALSPETAHHRRWVQSQEEAAKNLQHVEEQRQLRVAAAAQKRRSKAKSGSKASAIVSASKNPSDRARTQDSSWSSEDEGMEDSSVGVQQGASVERRFAFQKVPIFFAQEPGLHRRLNADQGCRKKLKLITQNVLMDCYAFCGYKNSRERWRRLLGYLAMERADIYVLQEVTPAFLEVLREEMKKVQPDLSGDRGTAGTADSIEERVRVCGVACEASFSWSDFHYANSALDLGAGLGSKSAASFGQLILSRFPIASAGELDVGLTKRVLFCEISAIAGSTSDGSASSTCLLVGALHLTSDHHGEKAHTRLLQLARIQDFLSHYKHEMMKLGSRKPAHLSVPPGAGHEARVVLAGDWNEDSMSTNPRRLRARRLLSFLDEPGVDGLEVVETDRKATYDPTNNPLAAEISSSNDPRPRRIDHIALSRGLRQVGVASTMVPRFGNGEFLSDHSGVACEFVVVSHAEKSHARLDAFDPVIPRLVSSGASYDKHAGRSCGGQNSLYGFAWLVPEGIEPVFDRRDSDFGDYKSPNRDDPHSLLYCSACSNPVGCEGNVETKLDSSSAFCDGILPAFSDSGSGASGGSKVSLKSIQGRFSAFFDFVQSIRASSDARFEAWPPHVTLVPTVVELDSYSAEGAVETAIAKYLDVNDEAVQGTIRPEETPDIDDTKGTAGAEEEIAGMEKEIEALKELKVHLARYFQRKDSKTQQRGITLSSA